MDHSPGVLIENLTVQNGVKGIYALNNSHVEINQVIVKDCTDRGIQIDTNSNATLSDSTIENTGSDGIGVLRNSGVTITGIVTTKDNMNRGMQLFLNSTALVYNSTFAVTGNDTQGISVTYNSGLYLTNSNLSMLSNNSDGLRISSGSDVGASSDSTVIIETSGENGIGVYGSSRLYSEAVIIVRGSVQGGVVASGTSDASFNGDVLIENCGAEGLTINRSSSGYVSKKFEVLNCKGAGIGIVRGSSFQNVDTANIIIKGTTEGDGVGIGLYGNSILRAGGGTFDISANATAGIEAGRNSTVSLRNKGDIGLHATISGNVTGIKLFQQGSLRTDLGLSITNNTGDGISLYQGSEAILWDITVESNGRWGINADGAESIEVYRSTIQNNHGDESDIYLGFGAKSTLQGNAVIGTALACDGSAMSRGDVVCPVIP